MKTLKNLLLFVAALWLLTACSKSDEFGGIDNGSNPSGAQIAVESNPVKVMVTYCQAEGCISEEKIIVNDLLTKTDHICLYDKNEQELTLMCTVCDYLGIDSKSIIRITISNN